MSSLAELVDAFVANEAAHPQVLSRVDFHLLDAPAPQLSLAEALRQFKLNEHQAAKLAADPGLSGDLIVFLSKTLSRVDPALRAAFPSVNALVAGAIPGAGVVVGLLLVLAEGPCLTLLEAWLAHRAAEIEAAERAAQEP